ncbi:M20 family metallopeptidase [Falsiroseomonas selenitidurans]|uniref:M20 family metallopeptidase n=1 Tax=Falsiroseomonas selenitidurans TaxID=2716335 RepID=A0ABX1E655_9PROT|nr:M20 family metallopeptidase [Falsiroseomonas selenitidurans]NKC32263.1 M20 family metallopeptidase [Falsiroseomonas selenitidurans]
MRELTAEALLRAVEGWVRLESPTQDAAAVNRMADHVAAKLRAIGARIERTPGRDGFADILLGRVEGERNDKPGLLVCGHVDTVHPVGTLAGALPFRVEGGRAYGPGIYDMKGGNAMAVAALEYLYATGRRPHLPVTVMMIPDEEMGSPSSRPAIEAEARRHAAVLVPEPSGEGGRLTVGRHGIARHHLRTIGRPAHAGATHAEGRSAIREMARQILAIEALTDHARQFYVNIGTVSGGTHENIVPAECRAICYALVPTAAEAAELAAALAALRPQDPDVRLEITPGLSRPPFGKTRAIQALYDHARALAADGPYPVLGERIAGGGSDGNFTGALGVPTLDGLGVIGGGPHSHEEHIEIGCLVPRTRLFVRLFETLGRPGAPLG